MTPTIEDVIRLAEQQFSENWVRMNAEHLAAFTTAARADLVAENERLKATPPDQRQDLHCVVSDIATECRELRQQLEESQAREVKMRKALQRVRVDGQQHMLIKHEALAIPSDDTALRELIAGVYEECAKVCEDHPDGLNMMGGAFVSCSAAIRALAEKANGE